MTLTYETPAKLIITLTDLLDRNGKSFSDVTNALFMLKKSASDSDEDARVSKSVGDGLTLQSDTIEVTILKTDYEKMPPGYKYLLCLGVEFNNSGFYIEDYDPDLNRKIGISKDKIRA